MTMLIDIDSTKKDADILRAAGFQIVDNLPRESIDGVVVPSQQAGFRLWIDQTVREILTPPLCHNCGTGMPHAVGTISLDGEETRAVKHTCPNCGSWILQARYTPEGK